MEARVLKRFGALVGVMETVDDADVDDDYDDGDYNNEL